MTSTELLSLAERLDDAPGVLGMLSRTDLAEAAAILRKLAELLPVAWIGSGGSILGHHPASYGLEDGSWRHLYQLSEVLTDD